MPAVVHLTAHTRDGDRSLLMPDRGSELWASLRSRVPGLLSACLMPNHLHGGAVEGSGEDFRATLRAFTRRFGVRFDVYPAQPAHTPAIALRMFRYIHLNPVRAGLVASPLSWTLSTARELFGAAAEPMVDTHRLVKVLGVPAHRLVAALTRLDDNKVERARKPKLIVTSVEAAVRATASAFRMPIDRVARTHRTRRVVIQVLREVGTAKPMQIAAALGCSERTVYRAQASRDPAVPAVLCCLGDPRLITCPEDL